MTQEKFINKTSNVQKIEISDGLDLSETLFENENGQEYCEKTIRDIDFTISYDTSDKYTISFKKNGENFNTKVNGKIFINNGKTVRKHLKEALVEFAKIDVLESGVIVDELWQEFSGEFGDIVFATSQTKKLKDAQYFRQSESLTLNVDVITDYILADNHFITYIDSKETLYYKDGVFVQYGDEEIEKIIRSLLKNYANNSKIREITSNIKVRTLINRNKVKEDLILINLKNGMFDIEQNKLLSHSPRYKSIRQLPIVYDASATCPQIEKFMNSIVTPEEVISLYESIGYAMIPKTNIKNSTLFLTGSGDNGKSKFLDMTRAFIGNDNVSSVSLHSLETDKFASSDLDRKLLNIFGDLSSETLYDNSAFKMLTGDDDGINMQKKYSNTYRVSNTARLMFAANKLPPVPDDDMEAFFNRMRVYTFENTFRGDNADKNIKEKITKTEELSGLFNIVIESLRTVLKNDAFTYDKSLEEIETIYRMHSDDIMIFADEKIIEDDSGKSIPKAIMYKIYDIWCVKNNIPIKSKNKFTRRLKSLGFFIGKKGSKGNQTLSWVNCKFKGSKDSKELIGSVSQLKSEDFAHDAPKIKMVSPPPPKVC